MFALLGSHAEARSKFVSDKTFVLLFLEVTVLLAKLDVVFPVAFHRFDHEKLPPAISEAFWVYEIVVIAAYVWLINKTRKIKSTIDLYIYLQRNIIKAINNNNINYIVRKNKQYTIESKKKTLTNMNIFFNNSKKKKW